MTFIVILLCVVGFIHLHNLVRKIQETQRDILRLNDELQRRVEWLEKMGRAEIGPAGTAGTQDADMRASKPAAESAQPTPPPYIPQTTFTREPDVFEKAAQKIKEYFTTGNTLVKVGVVLLFFGFSFLFKYAVDHGIFPLKLRLALAGAAGIGLTQFGWTLREKRRDYGLVLQGGGIGILILTTFVSLKFYQLLSPAFAFALLVSYTAAAAVLAVYQNSKNLAAFGFLGGFLAPILVSTGQGQHVVLFTYYALLNLGILYVSWKKTWRELNLLGFIFTFGIGTVWGALKYQPEFYASTQPFLILFFLIYVAISLIFANNKEPELKGYVDGTIVFGNSLITLMLQMHLVENIPYGRAFSALALAAFYILLSRYLYQHANRHFRLLAEAFISIGVVCLTIAIPLAVDGMKTSAVWALEAAGIYWIGVRQNRTPARLFATLLILATSVAFFLGPVRGWADLPFLNTFFISCLMMAAGSYTISCLSSIHAQRLSPQESAVPVVTIVIGTLWWLIGGLVEIDRHTLIYGVHLQLLYGALGAFLLCGVSQRYNWDNARYVTQSLPFFFFYMFALAWNKVGHPFADMGYVAWPMAIFICYRIFRRNDERFDVNSHFYFRLGHAAALWLIVFIGAMELEWMAAEYVSRSNAWRPAAAGLIPALVLWFVTEKKDLLKWPLQKYHAAYMKLGLTPIAVLAWIWLLVSNWIHGAPPGR